jgi:hypothetical protein
MIDDNIYDNKIYKNKSDVNINNIYNILKW